MKYSFRGLRQYTVPFCKSTCFFLYFQWEENICALREKPCNHYLFFFFLTENTTCLWGISLGFNMTTSKRHLRQYILSHILDRIEASLRQWGEDWSGHLCFWLCPGILETCRSSSAELFKKATDSKISTVLRSLRSHHISSQCFTVFSPV